MDNSFITSFQVPKGYVPFIDPFTDGNEPVNEEDQPKGAISQDLIDKLRFEIEKIVKKDGLDPKIILPYETKDEVVNRAVDTILDDILNFYAWYFSDDDRTIWIGSRAKDNQDINGDPIPWHDSYPETLRKAIDPIVTGLLGEMRDIGDIPDGQDTPDLPKTVTDNLSKYASNWQSWFYDRKILEDIEDYFEQASVYDEIYNEDDYGTLSNILNDDEFDGVSDVPYIGEQ